MVNTILQALEMYPQVWSATTRDATLRAERMKGRLWWNRNIMMTSGYLFYRWASVDGNITHIYRGFYSCGTGYYIYVENFTKTHP